MSRTKKSKAVPVVVILTILVAALAVVCFLINPLVIQPQKDAIAKANADAKAEVEERKRARRTSRSTPAGPITRPRAGTCWT